MPDIQMGSGIGSAVPGTGNDGSRGEIRDVIGPDTDAGQALIITAGALVLLGVTAGRNAPGLVGKAGAVLETVVIVASAAWAANYFARMYAIRHPDGPLAGGVTVVA